MAHKKFHKVYPNTIAVNADSKSPIAAKTESPKSSIWWSVKRFFRKKWLSFVTTVVLIWTLWAYLGANDISGKALKAAHTPWLSITSVSVVPNATSGVDLSYTVTNRSDSPAFSTRSWSVPVTTEYELGTLTNLEPNKRKDTFMPSDTRVVHAHFDPPNDEVWKKIISGEALLDVLLTYDDIFGRTISVEEEWKHDAIGYSVQNTKVSGF